MTGTKTAYEIVVSVLTPHVVAHKAWTRRLFEADWSEQWIGHTADHEAGTHLIGMA